MSFKIKNFIFDDKVIEKYGKLHCLTHMLKLYVDAGLYESYPKSGSNWYDLSSNSYKVITEDGASFKNSFEGYFNFNGTSNYMYLEDLFYSSGDTISEMTVLAWVRTTFNSGTPGTWNNNNWAILDFDRFEYFTFALNGTGEVAMAGSSTNYGGLGASFDLVGSTQCNDADWHFVGWTFSTISQQIVFYVDGKIDKLFNADGNMADLGSSTSATRYGIIGDGSEAGAANGSRNNIYYEGDISNIFYYEGRVLDSDEVNSLYKSTKNRYVGSDKSSIEILHDLFLSNNYDGNTSTNTVVSSIESEGFTVIATPTDGALAEDLSGTTQTSIANSGEFLLSAFDSNSDYISLSSGYSDNAYNGNPSLFMVYLDSNGYVGVAEMIYINYGSNTLLKDLFFPNQNRIFHVQVINSDGSEVSDKSGNTGTIFSDGQSPGSNGYHYTSEFSSDDGIWGFRIGQIVNGNGGNELASNSYGIQNYNTSDVNAEVVWGGSRNTAISSDKFYIIVKYD